MDAFMILLLNMTYQTAMIVCIVLLVRQMFQCLKVPKMLNYCLWLIPFTRMIIPWTVESDFSLLPIRHINRWLGQMLQKSVVTEHTMAQQAATQIQIVTNPQSAGAVIQMGNDIPMQTVSQGIRGVAGTTGLAELMSNEMMASGNWSWLTIVGVIWFIGVLALVIYSVVSYVRLKRKLVCSICLKENVYLADYIQTPFVLGILRPKIYLPSDIQEQELQFVLAHEKTHILRKDHLIKILAYFIASLHWFNPFAWIAFWFLSKDMEISCDEMVIRRLGEESREAYATALLQLTTGKQSLTGVPLAFGEGDTKGRIKNIMNHKKPLIIISVFAVLALVVLVVGLLTVPKEQTQEDSGGTTEVVIHLYNAMLDEDTDIGAVGPYLDYADEEIIIFHHWTGLFVYSREQKDFIGLIDLKSVGRQYTQGSNACDVIVSEDGTQAYIIPMPTAENADVFYIYNIYAKQKNVLMEYPQEDKWNVSQFDGLRDTAECVTSMPKGFRSSQCVAMQDGSETIYGYLETDTGLMKDLYYIEGEQSIPLFETYFKNIAVDSKYYDSYLVIDRDSTPKPALDMPEGVSGTTNEFQSIQNSGSYALGVLNGSVTTTSMNIEIVNNSTEEITCGDYFYIDRWEIGGWEEIPYVTENLAFHDIGYPVSAGDNFQKNIQWEYVYGELSPGLYLLRVPVSVLNVEGEYEQIELGVHFTIK